MRSGGAAGGRCRIAVWQCQPGILICDLTQRSILTGSGGLAVILGSARRALLLFQP